MAQYFTEDVFALNHVGVTDLQNIETNFAALKSSFSGTSSPSNVVGGMLWHDSTARKVRNYANSAWLISLMGDANQKMWVYRNDTCEGWLVDSSVTDVALAIKGGAQAYNVNGGNIAGSWTVGGMSHAHTHTGPSHNHQWYDLGASGDTSYNSAGAAESFTVVQKAYAQIVSSLDDDLAGLSKDYYTANAGTGNTGGVSASAVASDATWRPRAAVGTLQYPNLT
ncbi:MAG TPA: hypothetical protein DCZ95_12565 [Verrucomicrobia bacterium]|nr:hypothetical protein [Verrucomicrobiota bacterium]